MKKIVSLFVGASIVVAPFCVGAADDARLSMVYDKETSVINIEGTFGKREYEACTVYIFDADMKQEEISDSNPPLWADVVLTGADGLLSYTCVLPDSYESDEYTLRISSAYNDWSENFMYVNKASVSNLLELVNSAGNKSELEAVMIENTVILGIDVKEYELISEKTAEIMLASKPSGGFKTSGELINAIEQSIAASLLNYGQDASAVLKKYAKAISIDFEEDYGKFSDSVKSAIDLQLKNADYTKNTLAELYPELRCVAFFKAAPTRQAMKNAFYGIDESGKVIVSNFEVINPDMGVFDRISNKDEVFSELFKRRSELRDISAIRDVFEKCVGKVYDSEKSGGKNSGSSGGGGGSRPVSGNVTIEPGYVNQAPVVQKTSVFGDISVADWYYPSVEKLYELGLINGYEDSTFRPENPITRAEYTKLIVSVAEYPKYDTLSSENDITFDDVDKSDWFYGAVMTAANAGLVMGNGTGFKPDDKITRQDASVILYRFVSKLKYAEGSFEFSDSSQIADYAKDAVGALYSSGIISGMDDGRFAPCENLTRAQAAKLLCGAIEFLN